MTVPRLSTVFGLTPEAAVDFFRQKGFKIGFDHRDVWQAEHQASFTVAKAMQLDLLRDIRAAVDDAIANGTTFEDFQKNLKPLLVKRGWWGKKEMADPLTGEVKAVQLGSPRRLKVIYDTNLRTAHAEGQWQRIQASKAALPFLMYSHTPSKWERPEHAAWDGLILPVDDPWWQTHLPVKAWGCKCRVIPLTEAQAAKQGGPHQAPASEMREYVNKRTGEKQMIPAGIDPAFHYPPGGRRENLDKMLSDKIAALPLDLRQAAERQSPSGEEPTFTPELREQIRQNMQSAAGDGLPLGVARNAALYVVGQGIKDKAEHLIAFDAASGKEIERFSSGIRGEVAIPPKTWDLLNNKNARVNIHHNHPDSYSLSGKDLDKLAYPGGWKVVAHGHDGSVFSAAKIPGMAKHIEKAHSAALAAVIQDAKLFRVRTEGVRAHLVNLALARAGVIKYDFTLSSGLQAIMDAAPATYDRIIADAVAAITREIAP
ncbi:MAG: hypothetical protein LBE62_02975 [Azonexus sp.]|jgi:hypothetical protein|nr:hypothetical protein [Azonexus sp.]